MEEPEKVSSVKSLTAQQSGTQMADPEKTTSVKSLHSQKSGTRSIVMEEPERIISVKSLHSQKSGTRSIVMEEPERIISVKSLHSQKSGTVMEESEKVSSVKSLEAQRSGSRSITVVDTEKISSSASLHSQKSGRSVTIETPEGISSVHSLEGKPSTTRSVTIEEPEKPSSVQSLEPKESITRASPSSLAGSLSRTGFRLENIGSQIQMTRVWSELDNRIQEPIVSMSTPVVTKLMPGVSSSGSSLSETPSTIDIKEHKIVMRSADAILQHIIEKVYSGEVVSDKMKKKKEEEEDLSGYITHPDDELVDPNPSERHNLKQKTAERLFNYLGTPFSLSVCGQQHTSDLPPGGKSLQLIEPEPEPVPSDHGLFGEGQYVFPYLENPGLDRALNDTVEPKPDFGVVGVEKYLHLCKALGVVPAAHFIKALYTDTVSFKYYGVEPRAIRAICESLVYNQYVTNIDLEGNWLTRDAAYHLAELLRESTNIVKLNLAHCNLGYEGALKLVEGLLFTASLRELDLSWNSLEDEGMAALAPGITDNCTITHLNLSHNNLGNAAGIVLGAAMEDNWAIQHLDLSWNNLYYKDSIKALFHGLSRNNGLHYLNLAGNSFSGKEVGKCLKGFIGRHNFIHTLDLTHNRLDEDPLSTMKEGLARNENLETLKLGFNPISPETAEGLLEIFQNPSCGLQELDLEEVWVKKTFPEALEKVKEEREVNVKYRGVIANFDIKGPDVKKLLLDRAKFEAENQKKKKKRKDFGHFLLKIPDKPMRRPTFREKIDEFKIKINPDLTEALIKTFVGEKKKVDVTDMREYYMKLYPDTKLPEKKKKKSKRKSTKAEAPPPVEEAPAAPVIVIRKPGESLSRVEVQQSRVSFRDPVQDKSKSHHDIAERLKSTVELAERTQSIVEAASTVKLPDREFSTTVEQSVSKKSVSFPTNN